MSHAALFSRKPRDFTRLKLWAASLVGREEAGDPTEGAADAPSAQKTASKIRGAAAGAQRRLAPTLKLEAVPHPSDAFLKGEGE